MGGMEERKSDDQGADKETNDGTCSTDSKNVDPNKKRGSYRDSVLRFGKDNDKTHSVGQEEGEDSIYEIMEDLEDDVVQDGKEEDPMNPVIPTSKEERLEWSKPWKGSLIIKLMGRRVGFKFLQTKLHKLWNPSGGMKITDMDNDYYLVSTPEIEQDAFGSWMHAKKTFRRTPARKETAPATRQPKNAVNGNHGNQGTKKSIKYLL
ncbi:uncharacterized protein G2W53_017235 [Senna tora]|uniref:DUF4283 domain-containing protein n=1 Tax=Senna tora TaxID=362788 RepID=A0A834WNS2_9FABA|nr:uncharacterized protein G2W53_017235 [Senna tora]